MDKIIFVSHAAADKELAISLKETLNLALPTLDVFVSSDPEDLQPGDPWVKVVLDNLVKTGVLLALCTNRGLSRKWVWFESGAAWMSQLPLIPCAIGEQRKDKLPAPFSSYQGLNIDLRDDLKSLLRQLAKQFVQPVPTLDYSSICENLTRIDVRIEERQKLESGNTLARRKAENVRKSFESLGEPERYAIKLLLMEGPLSDNHAIKKVQLAGIGYSAVAIFPAIAETTNFVQRTWPPDPAESSFGYRGTWFLNPELKPFLEAIVFP